MPTLKSVIRKPWVRVVIGLLASVGCNLIASALWDWWQKDKDGTTLQVGFLVIICLTLAFWLWWLGRWIAAGTLAQTEIREGEVEAWRSLLAKWRGTPEEAIYVVGYEWNPETINAVRPQVQVRLRVVNASPFPVRIVAPEPGYARLAVNGHELPVQTVLALKREPEWIQPSSYGFAGLTCDLESNRVEAFWELTQKQKYAKLGFDSVALTFESEDPQNKGPHRLRHNSSEIHFTRVDAMSAWRCAM